MTSSKVRSPMRSRVSYTVASLRRILQAFQAVTLSYTWENNVRLYNDCTLFVGGFKCDLVGGIPYSAMLG